ncbi:MAG: GIY-YIG nuclease family protein [Candidatus Taylorbacteria bacterium]|nr:GIY-YIG nuclease family protein [Candidatus Taylorbacteria bacterium]
MEKTSGIYYYQNKINGKRYIGQACNIERRSREHEYHLVRGTDKCVALQRAVNKYGIENLEFGILEICTPEVMNDREVYWIDKYKSSSRDGYNISNGGKNGLIGHKPSSEVCAKISKSKLEKHWKMSEEQKIGISKLHKGKPKSEETKRRMSENHARYMLGRHHSNETVEKMKISHGGKNAWQLGKKSPNAASQYFGVYKLVQKGHLYWTAQIKFEGKRVYLGFSKGETESARLYDAYVIANNLPNPLNFPEEKK